MVSQSFAVFLKKRGYLVSDRTGSLSLFVEQLTEESFVSGSRQALRRPWDSLPTLAYLGRFWFLGGDA